MSQSDSERPILIIQNENQPSQQWAVNKDNIVLGRGEDSDIVLAERQISRHHIRVYREGDRYFVEDLNSKNGTWVNGQQLKGSRELVDGDEIHVALAIRIRFIGANSTLTTDIPLFVSGSLRLDPEARRVFVREIELDPPLSLPQYRLLELLYVNVGRICTRDSVIEAVWPEAVVEGVSEQAIDALVRRLRDRLNEVDPTWQYIVTVRGHGFRLENAPIG